jgi:hypothetical protein
MKTVLTQNEYESLDSMAAVAMDLGRIQATLIARCEQLLGVDAWDQKKRTRIARYVHEGAPEHIEAFLQEIGVSIDRVPDTAGQRWKSV